MEAFFNTPSIYKTEYDNLSKAKEKRINVLNRLENLNLVLYLDGDENNLPSIPPLEDAEESKSEPDKTIGERVKLEPWERKITGIGLKILTRNKVLTRLQIKSGNNSDKIRSKIREILYQHNKITKKVYKNSVNSL